MSQELFSIRENDARLIVEADPLQMSVCARLICFIFIAIALGFVCFGLLSDSDHSIQKTWIALQSNYLYFMILSGTMCCFSAVFHICNAQWVRPIRRLFESGLPFFLFSPIGLLILLIGRSYIFGWAHGDLAGKGVWFDPVFLYTRDVFGLLIVAFAGMMVVKKSAHRDIFAIRGGLVEADSTKLDRWNFHIAAANEADARKKILQEHSKMDRQMSRWSPAVVILYCLIMSMIAFDQLMSVDPHWFSTLFGVFFFISGAYLSIAWVAMMILYARRHPIFKAKISPNTLHDLGKLLFGFGIFWAYLFWSHYLPIWYGNLPEETAWLILRMREHPWQAFGWVVLGLCFIIPFFLGLNRDLKRIPCLLAGTGFIVGMGIWLQFHLLIAPYWFPNEIPLSWRDFAIFFGFTGAFALSVDSFLKKCPLIPFGDMLSGVTSKN